MSTTQSRRDKLLKSLQGEKVSIPDLRPIFQDWPGIEPNIINPCKEKLGAAVNDRLEHLCSTGVVKPSTLKALRAADFALFTALWWPDASFERARILAFLVIWLFTWDDEIDEPTGFCSDDMKAAEGYRRDTLKFVRRCLSLPLGSAGRSAPGTTCHPIIESFREIGDSLRTSYTTDQREYFYREIQRFIQMSRREQKVRLAGCVPTLADYWQFRMGTSAVYIGVAACEFANDSHLPTWVMKLPCMKAIWEETNMIISIVNDLLSLKKEIAKGCIDSAVPLTCASGLDVHSAITKVIEQLRVSATRFDFAATSLSNIVAGDLRLSKQVARFVYVCRTNCTGNLVWSLRTSRYAMSSAETSGSWSFILGDKP